MMQVGRLLVSVACLLGTSPAIAADMETVRLRGMYVSTPEAATFTDCATGRQFPVANDANHATLERAYLSVRRRPGEVLLATFDGRVEARVHESSGAYVEHVVVERFARVWLEKKCEEGDS